MSELDLNGTNANKSGEAPTTGEELNHANTIWTSLPTKRRRVCFFHRFFTR